jgi:glycosyltransferase involved in cell wall biosynthesis
MPAGTAGDIGAIHVTSPLLSIVVPVYNGAAFIDDAIRTIRNQNLPEAEVLFVDDGSTDGSAAQIAERMPEARVIRQANQGGSAARNTGLRESSGELLVFLDVDDLWPEDTLRKHLLALRENPSADITHMTTRQVRVLPDGEMEFLGEAWQGPNLASMVIRRRVFDQVGPLSVDIRLAEDVDWFWRAREAGVVIHFIPEVGLYYRRHDASVTAGRGWKEQKLTSIIQRSLARRRAAGKSGALPLFENDEHRH